MSVKELIKELKHSEEPTDMLPVPAVVAKSINGVVMARSYTSRF